VAKYYPHDDDEQQQGQQGPQQQGQQQQGQQQQGEKTTDSDAAQQSSNTRAPTRSSSLR
jgi:hypothetical protein